MRSVLIIWNSHPHKPLWLGLGELDRLVNRFLLLSALGNHFADRAVSEHLRAEACWGRIAGEQGGDITARRIIVKGARGRFFVLPGLEVAQVLEWRNVNTMTPGDELFSRRAGRQICQEALRRG